MKKSTIIVPVYNEEKRASFFLQELIDFCQSTPDYFSVIFVNDGSTDNTLNILQPFADQNNFVRIISYTPNKGKGFAVKKAVLESTTDYILFIDADGSISPTVIPEMLQKLETYDVVVGSRALETSEAIQHPTRKFIGVIFNKLVNLIFWTGIQDNLCGVKGFTNKSALLLFSNLKTNRWVFDVEIFFRIKKEKLSLYQMPIFWEHKTGSKIKMYDPIIMFFNLITLRLKLLFNY